MIKKCIKLSDFIKIESSPFILGALISRIMTLTDNGNNYFYAYTSFRTSKYVHHSKFDFFDYSKKLIEKLNYFSQCDNWVEHIVNESNIELRFYILNDVNMSKKVFYNAVYRKIISSQWLIDEDKDAMHNCMRGFMEPRGSVDTTAKLIAQDYFYDDTKELKKAQMLTEMLNIPFSYANFNARDLQPQFVSGVKKRNAQFRIKLFYYANQIGFLNDYKALVFETAYSRHDKIIKDGITYFNVPLPRENSEVTFIEYLNFYTNNIYQKKLTPQAIKELREQLNFENESPSSSNSNRNRTIIELFDRLSEDKCAVCGTTETYYSPAKGKQYFEIHHVIPFCNGNELDNMANLVKLCPTCHRMLKKGSGTKEDQTKAIIKILHEYLEIFEFASSYLGIDDINALAEKIQSRLG